jgi:hypothetical protein
MPRPPKKSAEDKKAVPPPVMAAPPPQLIPNTIQPQAIQLPLVQPVGAPQPVPRVVDNESFLRVRDSVSHESIFLPCTFFQQQLLCGVAACNSHGV